MVERRLPLGQQLIGPVGRTPDDVGALRQSAIVYTHVVRQVGRNRRFSPQNHRTEGVQHLQRARNRPRAEALRLHVSDQVLAAGDVQRLDPQPGRPALHIEREAVNLNEVGGHAARVRCPLHALQAAPRFVCERAAVRVLSPCCPGIAGCRCRAYVHVHQVKRERVRAGCEDDEVSVHAAAGKPGAQDHRRRAGRTRVVRFRAHIELQCAARPVGGQPERAGDLQPPAGRGVPASRLHRVSRPRVQFGRRERRISRRQRRPASRGCRCGGVELGPGVGDLGKGAATGRERGKGQHQPADRRSQHSLPRTEPHSEADWAGW